MKQMLDGCSKMCNMCVDIHALPKRVLCFNHNTSVGVRQTHCLGHGRRSDTALGNSTVDDMKRKMRYRFQHHVKLKCVSP